VNPIWVTPYPKHLAGTGWRASPRAGEASIADVAALRDHPCGAIPAGCPEQMMEAELPVTGRRPVMELESLNWTFVIDTFLLLLIGIGPKIALVPFLEATKQMPQAIQRRVLRKMLTTAATVALLLLILGGLLTSFCTSPRAR
jgi:hypothetical protein